MGGGGADWIQISKELGLIHVFERLSLLRGEENRTEILNLILFIDKSNAEERVNLSPCHSFKIELKTSVHQNSVFFWTTLSLCKLKVRKALLIAG